MRSRETSPSPRVTRGAGGASAREAGLPARFFIGRQYSREIERLFELSNVKLDELGSRGTACVHDPVRFGANVARAHRSCQCLSVLVSADHASLSAVGTR